MYFVLTNRLEGEPIKAFTMYEDDYKNKARFVGEIIGQLSLALEKVDAVVNDVNIYDTVKNWALPKVKNMLDIPESFWKDTIEYFGSIYDTLPNKLFNVILIQAIYYRRRYVGIY